MLDHVMPFEFHISTFTAYCITWVLNTTWILLWDCCVLLKVFIPLYSRQDRKKNDPQHSNNGTKTLRI